MREKCDYDGGEHIFVNGVCKLCGKLQKG